MYSTSRLHVNQWCEHLESGNVIIDTQRQYIVDVSEHNEAIPVHFAEVTDNDKSALPYTTSYFRRHLTIIIIFVSIK